MRIPGGTAHRSFVLTAGWGTKESAQWASRVLRNLKAVHLAEGDQGVEPPVDAHQLRGDVRVDDLLGCRTIRIGVE